MVFLVLKFLHILMVVMGVGALIAEYVLLTVHKRSEENEQRRASEKMAYVLVKKVASPALLLAFLFGLGMALTNMTYFKLPHMHVKMLLALFLVGLPHMEGANLRKMLVAAEAKDEVLINTLKKRHSTYMVASSVLVLAIFYLIIFKPF